MHFSSSPIFTQSSAIGIDERVNQQYACEMRSLNQHKRDINQLKTKGITSFIILLCIYSLDLAFLHRKLLYICLCISILY